jgi:hypothetical protein
MKRAFYKATRAATELDAQEAFTLGLLREFVDAPTSFSDFWAKRRQLSALSRAAITSKFEARLSGGQTDAKCNPNSSEHLAAHTPGLSGAT